MADKEDNLIVICGTAEEIIYKNPENGYIVLTLNCDNSPETVVGTLGDIVEGESLKLRGSYISNAKYGRQFKAVTCERTLPTTAEEIRRYLGSGIIKGVGPAMAKKIVAAYGTEALDVIENDPKRLAELNGITVDKALYIGHEFRKLNGIKSVIEFLQKYDISPITASLIWKEYEAKSLVLLKENPYLLCDSNFEVSFMIADRIAFDLELSQYSVNRIKAGIAYVLRENAFAGHTCLPREKLSDTVCRTISVGEDDFDKALWEGIQEGSFAELPLTKRTYIYLYDYYSAEKYIAEKISLMLKLSAPLEKDYSGGVIVFACLPDNLYVRLPYGVQSA